MAQKLEAKPVIIRCFFENWVKSKKCFVLVHDGSKGISSKSRNFFTRTYALVRHGDITGFCVKFTYDYRDNLADVTIDDLPMTLKMKYKHDEQITDEMIDKVVQEHRLKA